MLGNHFLHALLALCVALTQLVPCLARSATGDRALLVFDDRVDEIAQYSQLIESLRTQHGLAVDTVELSDKAARVDLFNRDIRLYDHLLVFPVKGKHFAKQLAAKKLLRFTEDGGNVVAVTAPRVASDSVHQYLNQLGIYPAPRTQHLVDLVSGSDVIAAASNASLNAHVYSDAALVFGDSVSPALLDNRPQIIPLVQASKSSFAVSANKTREQSWTQGAQGYIAAAFQNNQNARALWLGSTQALSNANFAQNAQALGEMLKWTFQEKAVLKVTGVSHAHADSGLSYDQLPYKVTDDVVYNISIAQWDGDAAQWAPYVADDVQFELRQIDPYYRITMHALGADPRDATAELYSTGAFKMPNRHGMFTFATDYQRQGVSYLSEQDIKAIRHLANDEYPRSWEITNAWVYAAAIASVIASFVGFVFFFVTAPASLSDGFTDDKKKN